MTTLYVVSSSTGAAPEEGDSSARVIGAYTDSRIAAAVQAAAWGVGASITQVEIDHIDPLLLQEIVARGIDLGGVPPPLVRDGMVFIDNRADYAPGVLEAASTLAKQGAGARPVADDWQGSMVTGLAPGQLAAVTNAEKRE